ncbi:hypothetical protein [Desulfovibrio ferrophilus]|uniref:Lipoprotein n=1 Tax=Desulfovibrio ferrophilus TaxID=241368 RepID=A0A2Z6AXW7_9BACT|nr:hypothetical protein [Desulfovibrio ferrophilus]BBD08081.1 uncharacterized protein DFE_1355 [Desulfovibrio ferrophilus]
MRTLLMLLALVIVTATGCAQQQSQGVNDEVLMDCRSQADEHHKARYSDDWEAAVQQCLARNAQ